MKKVKINLRKETVQFTFNKGSISDNMLETIVRAIKDELTKNHADLVEMLLIMDEKTLKDTNQIIITMSAVCPE